jgi:hypothetical protein
MSSGPSGPPGVARYTTAQRRLLTLSAGVGVAVLAGVFFVLTYEDLRALVLAGRAAKRFASAYPVMYDALVVVTILSLVVARHGRWWSRWTRWPLLLLLLGGAAAAGVQRAVRGYEPLPDQPLLVGVAVAPHLMLVIAVWLWLTMFKQARAAMARRSPGARPPATPATAAHEAGGDDELVPGMKIADPVTQPVTHAAPPQREQPGRRPPEPWLDAGTTPAGRAETPETTPLPPAAPLSKVPHAPTAPAEARIAADEDPRDQEGHVRLVRGPAIGPEAGVRETPPSEAAQAEDSPSEAPEPEAPRPEAPRSEAAQPEAEEARASGSDPLPDTGPEPAVPSAPPAEVEPITRGSGRPPATTRPDIVALGAKLSAVEDLGDDMELQAVDRAEDPDVGVGNASDPDTSPGPRWDRPGTEDTGDGARADVDRWSVTAAEDLERRPPDPAVDPAADQPPPGHRSSNGVEGVDGVEGPPSGTFRSSPTPPRD